MRTDAVMVAVHDQLRAGLDVITDGEQSRYDFNLSFYGRLEGIRPTPFSLRRFGPPAHDQRGKYPVTGTIASKHGLGALAEFKLLQKIAPPGGPILKASLPGPYTLSGRIEPGGAYPSRWEVTDALIPIVRAELEQLVDAGCREITLDEPSMSCYAHREDAHRFPHGVARDPQRTGERNFLQRHSRTQFAFQDLLPQDRRHLIRNADSVEG